MNTRYYISHKARINDHHTIHKEGCPLIPCNSDKTYLGVFDDPSRALEKGKKYYSMAEKCPFCCKEQTLQPGKAHVMPVRNIRDIVKERIMSHEASFTGMLCSVN